MKKVFVPNRIELERMRAYGANIYKYLLVKAIESVIVYGLENTKNGSILESAYDEVRDNFYIEDGVCKLYPEEIPFTKITRKSSLFCIDILEHENCDCNLDKLSYFSDETLYNRHVMTKVIKMLGDVLKKNPRYRFEYKDNLLLNRIFNAEISEEEFRSVLEADVKLFKILAGIEPYYAYSIGCDLLDSRFEINIALNCSINKYAKRYGIHNDAFDYYEGEDVFKENILNFDGFKLNPYEEAKPLIRCINRTNKTLTRK